MWREDPQPQFGGGSQLLSRHTDGWFRRLAIAYSANVAGDTLIALALANTLFFSVPTAEARSNVVAYLLITVAPFAVIGPYWGRYSPVSPAATGSDWP